MNDSYFSPSFPTRAAIKRAAFVDAQITAMRANGAPIPPTLVREAQHAMAMFRNLPAHEQAIVSRTFNADIATLVESTHVEVETRQAEASVQKVDTLMRDLTKDMGANGKGLSLEMAAALRAGDRVKVATRKRPTGAAADELVKQATGLTRKQYEKLLDDGVFQRNQYKYDSPEKYDSWLAKNFPGRDPLDVDRMLSTWNAEAAGLELQRRAEAKQPDSVTIRADASAQRRLALIEAVARSGEASDPDSIFAKTHADRLEAIKAEGTRDGSMDLRASVADAFLQHAPDLEVSRETMRDDVDDTNILATEEDAA